MKMFKRNILVCSFIVIATILLGSCSNTTRTSNQKGNQKDSTVRLNRNVKIGFQGFMLGTPNKDISASLKRLPNVTEAEIPYEIEQNSDEGNASIYANENEEIKATFKSEIIDKKKSSHEGYGMIFSDGDSVTEIVFTIPETKDPYGLYSKLFPLFTSKYGTPDKSYEKEDEETGLRNIGDIWIFDNKQRICLNQCVYSGSTSDEWGSLYATYQRVEIIYQDINALERKTSKEKQDVQRKKAAQEAAKKAEKERNEAKMKTQQL